MSCDAATRAAAHGRNCSESTESRQSACELPGCPPPDERPCPWATVTSIGGIQKVGTAAVPTASVARGLRTPEAPTGNEHISCYFLAQLHVPRHSSYLYDGEWRSIDQRNRFAGRQPRRAVSRVGPARAAVRCRRQRWHDHPWRGDARRARQRRQMVLQGASAACRASALVHVFLVEWHHAAAVPRRRPHC